jgi:hypothetical protein
MKCTVVEIHHPHQYDRPYIRVRVRRSGTVRTLDAFRRQHLYDQLSVGDVVDATHQTNNPYLIPTNA